MWKRLAALAAPVSERGRTPQQVFERTLLDVLHYAKGQKKYLTRQQLADLLNRDPETVSTYLRPLLKRKNIVSLYESSKHPKQAYQGAE